MEKAIVTREEFMKYLVIIINLVFVLNSYADYILFNKTTGNIEALCSGRPKTSDQTDILEFTGKWDAGILQTKKIVNGVLTDKEEYGRKITVTGDTELTAGPNPSTTLTIRLLDRNGNLLTGLDRDLKITTTRGKLGKIKGKSVNGELAVTFRGVDETVECIITVSDPAGEFISAVHRINLVP